MMEKEDKRSVLALDYYKYELLCDMSANESRLKLELLGMCSVL
jgi:hypothetical protein